MSLEKQVRRVVRDQLGLSAREAEEAEILAELPMDSLDEVELIMAIEEEFGIEIPDAVAENLKSIPDIVSYVTEAQSE